MMLGRLSVRTRMTLWHAGVLTLIICVFSAGIFLFVKARINHELNLQLGREMAAVEKMYREEPAEMADLRGVTLFQVIERGNVLHRTEAWEQGGLVRGLQEASGTAPKSWTALDGRQYRVQTATGPSYQIAVAVEESSFRQTLWTLAVILAIGVPCAIGAAIVGGYFLAGRVLAPVGMMAEKARKITADSLGERLPVENPGDEFGRLACVFNDTLSRLHDSFERLRRFTADASHELRTPLTAMRSVGEVALQSPREPTAYRDVIGSMLEEVDRLTRLIDSLLTLTRAESGRIELTREVVDLGGLVTGVVDNLRVLAEEKQQSLRVDAATPIRVECDPTILRQGLMNLLHNAIKYTPKKGAINIKLTKTVLGKAAIEVKDAGPGIPAAHQERIFERFYRVDAGRSSEVGGVGLGLAIARWAVEVNGGHIELESEDGKGSLFRVVIPVITQ